MGRLGHGEWWNLFKDAIKEWTVENVQYTGH